MKTMSIVADHVTSVLTAENGIVLAIINPSKMTGDPTEGDTFDNVYIEDHGSENILRGPVVLIKQDSYEYRLKTEVVKKAITLVFKINR